MKRTSTTRQCAGKAFPLALLMFCCALACPTAAAELPLGEAIRTALAHNPDILVQTEEVGIARARQSQAAGQFDLFSTAAVNYSRVITPFTNESFASTQGAINSDQRTFTSGYQLGLKKQLRNGINIAGNVEAIGEQSNDLTLPWQPQQNTLKLGIVLNVPLMKGRGVGDTGAAEEAARLEVLATRHDARDRAAQTIYQALLAYWDYRARVEQEKIAASTEERSATLLKSIEKLVAASEKPRADLVLLRADLAEKTAGRIAAGLAVAESRRSLGRIMGLDAAAIDRLPDPADRFPPISDKLLAVAGREPAMVAAALAHRADVLALNSRLQSARVQLDAAGKEMRPQVDLNLGVSSSRVSEGGSRYGFASTPGRTQPGASVFAALNYQFPIANRQATGLYSERSGQLAQLMIKQRDLATGVATAIDSALLALLRSAEQLKASEDSLVFYEQAVNQEIVKQKNGFSTLIDVINVETRFNNARNGYLQLQLAYADAIARLKFETGTLLQPTAAAEADPDAFSLDVPGLTDPGTLISLASTATDPLRQ